MNFFDAQYIIRLDDACPTMRVEIWENIERVLNEFGIQPIVGVIPDNQDCELFFSPPDIYFWDKVRRWHSLGWEIALHGLHHRYHAIRKTSSIMPLSTNSEFAELPLLNQERILLKSYDIFAKHGLRPRAFMAPSHTFDKTTLEALKNMTNIRVITDGHALSSYISDGFTWLPQQLWRFRCMPFGIWCICLHPNTMTLKDVSMLRSCLLRHAHKFVNFEFAIRHARPRVALDFLFQFLYRFLLSVKKFFNFL